MRAKVALFLNSCEGIINHRLALIALLMVVFFGIAEAKSLNEIWIHDSRLCVKADSTWLIESHHPFGEQSYVGFLLLQDKKASAQERQLWYHSKLLISTYDLPNEDVVSEFENMMASKPIDVDDVSVTKYEHWLIMTWSEECDGKPYRYIEARRIYENKQVGVYCLLSYPLLQDSPVDYDKRMRDAQRAAISQLIVESKNLILKKENTPTD